MTTNAIDQLLVIQAIYAAADQPAPPLKPAHPSHQFGGEEGRCWSCDCRPFGRWAPEPCNAA